MRRLTLAAARASARRQARKNQRPVRIIRNEVGDHFTSQFSNAWPQYDTVEIVVPEHSTVSREAFEAEVARYQLSYRAGGL